MRSKTAIQLAVNEPIVIGEVLLPNPEPDQVIVKLFTTGICHSQLHQLRNPSLDRPLVLGHEATGIVIDKGGEIEHVNKGDHVIISWITTPSISNNSTLMSPLYTSDDNPVYGILVYTWGEEIVARGKYVFPISKNYPTDVTSIVGCAVATGVGAVINTARVHPGKSVAVFGVGGVGLSAIGAASIYESFPLIAIDIRDDKLELAKEFGATHVVNSSTVDPVESVIDISEGGVDYAFDTVGKKATAEQILTVLRPGGQGINNFGGTAILVGNPPPEITLDPMHFQTYQKQYTGSHGASYPERDFPMILHWYQEGKLPLDKLVSHRYRLNQINEAYESLKNGEILGRAIIEY